MYKIFVVIFLFFFCSKKCDAQNQVHFEEIIHGKWKVFKVKNLLLERGALYDNFDDFKSVKKIYMGSVFIFSNRTFTFPRSLENTSSYTPKGKIELIYTVLKKKDTDLSFRFPGDELNCDSTKINNGNCFVGNTFMDLLEYNSKVLTVINARDTTANNFIYKIFYQHNVMGIYLVNSNILLLLKKTGS